MLFDNQLYLSLKFTGDLKFEIA